MDRFVKVATPVTVLAVSVPPSVPIPVASAVVTTVPVVGTVLPKTSARRTAGCTANGTPLCAAPEGCVWIWSWVAMPAMPVAVKVTGLPARPADVAVATFAPATFPSVHEVAVATPRALVRTGVTGRMLPPPPVTANVTETFATGLPLASVTLADGGAATIRPAVSVWGVTELAAMVVAAAALTVKATLVAPVNPVAAAPSVYPAAALFSVRVPNVATPATALTVVVPPSVLPPGFAASAIVTALVAVVTVLPAPSRTRTVGAGVMANPAVTVVGCCTNSSAVAVPGVSAMEVDTSLVRPAEVKDSVRAPMVPVMIRLLKVATPATAATVGVPVSVPPPVATAAVTFAVEVGTRFPDTSCTRTTVAGAITVPLCAVAGGSVVMTSLVAAPADRVIGVEVTPVRLTPVNCSVYAPTSPVMLSPGKVARPFTSVG